MLEGLHPTSPRPSKTAIATLLLLALAVSAIAIGATPAGAESNSGTVKVHDGTTADPPQRNEPHVACDGFWVEGFNMAVDSGGIDIFSWPPTGDQTKVLEADWSADDGTPAYHFLAGPFTLPEGHYRVEVGNADGHVKSKMFWVECGESTPPSPTPTPTPSPTPSETQSESPSPSESQSESPSPSDSGTSSSTTTSTAPPQANGPECPTGITATANGDGSVTLRWTPAPGADGTNIYRGAGGDDLEYVTTVGGDVSEYLDNATTAGNGYAYVLTTLEGDRESSGCPAEEVTAIPVFPTVMALGLASALGAGAYLALAVRRKLP